MNGFNDDYIMRQIEGITKAAAKMIGLHTEAVHCEEPEVLATTDMLLHKIDVGEINEAENALYDVIEPHTMNGFITGLAFYSYLQNQDDAYLEAHDFSREEVEAGILHLGEQYGIGEDVTMFLP